MGTTQRIIPGVTGEPNWSNLNHAITSLAKNVEKEQSLTIDAEKAADQVHSNPTKNNEKAVALISRQQRKLNNRRSRHFHSALKNLIATGGGRKSVAGGKSSSLGRAGIKSSKRISHFIGQVHANGLDTALQELGFGPLKGRKLKEVMDFLLMHFSDTSSGMDEVAANMASCEVFGKLAEGVKTVKEFEEKLKSMVEENSLTEVICNFFGVYLFEHLSQRFQEKITQLKGEPVSAETFKIIKADILGQVRLLNSNKAISEINWKGKEGRRLEEKIFNSIIQIFE